MLANAFDYHTIKISFTQSSTSNMHAYLFIEWLSVNSHVYIQHVHLFIKWLSVKQACMFTSKKEMEYLHSVGICTDVSSPFKFPNLL